jgi:hypothetical protein
VLDDPHGLLLGFGFQEVVDEDAEHPGLVRDIRLDVGVDIEVVPYVTVERDDDETLFCYRPVDS